MSAEIKIRDEIDKCGFITIDKFMEIALYDKDYGYYIKENPIGKDQDFITAPEITSLFGETISLLFVDIIIKNLQNYDKINLVELGAGKGTLALDILDSISRFPDIYQKIRYVILECNIILVENQKKMLSKHIDKVNWIKSLEELNSHSPVIFLANEFFDCLPIKQFFKQNNEFFERIIVKNGENLLFSDKKTEILPEIISSFSEDYEEDEIIEYSEASKQYIDKISEIIAKQKGYALIIDYGYNSFSFGDSLQSISRHKFNCIFQKIGQSDLTVHVNFRILYYFASKHEKNKLSLFNQSDFLKQLGIELLVQKKSLYLDEIQKKDLFLAVNRLIDLGQMGELFKCFVIENF